MATEPLPDIQAQVKEHAHRAMVLSEIEVLPPGYTKLAWAVLLMDNDYAWLLDRYAKKVQAETERLENLVRGPSDRDMYDRLANAGVYFLPATPKVPPPELAAKCREVYTKWLGKLVEQECLASLQHLLGSKRNVALLMEAQDIIHRTLESLAERVGQMPYTVNVTMNNVGGFNLTLQEKPPSRSVR